MTDVVVSIHTPRRDPRPLSHRVGLDALSTDQTFDVDFALSLSPAGVGAYVNRIPFANPVTPDTMRAMEGDLADGTALILPGEELDAIVFGCRTASVCIGDAAARAQVGKGKPGCPVVAPISAALTGLPALGARRICVLPPYSVETTQPMAGLVEAEGFTLDRVTCLNMGDDRDMARVSPDDLVELAAAAINPASEALVVSCTARPTASVMPLDLPD